MATFGGRTRQRFVRLRAISPTTLRTSSEWRNSSTGRGAINKRKRHDRNATQRPPCHSFSRARKAFWAWCKRCAPTCIAIASRMVGSVSTMGRMCPGQLWRRGLFGALPACQNHSWPYLWLFRELPHNGRAGPNPCGAGAAPTEHSITRGMGPRTDSDPTIHVHAPRAGHYPGRCPIPAARLPGHTQLRSYLTDVLVTRWREYSRPGASNLSIPAAKAASAPRSGTNQKKHSGGGQQERRFPSKSLCKTVQPLAQIFDRPQMGHALAATCSFDDVKTSSPGRRVARKKRSLASNFKPATAKNLPGWQMVSSDTGDWPQRGLGCPLPDRQLRRNDHPRRPNPR